MAACTQRAGTITPVKSSVVRGRGVGVGVSGIGVTVGMAVGVLVGEIAGVGDRAAGEYGTFGEVAGAGLTG